MIDFSSSCLICAHPDDEIIYFGSIIEKVSKIVLVYMVDPHREYQNRIQFINHHPLKDKILYVMMDESGCFQTTIDGNKIDCIDWKTTKPTKYGLKFRDGVFIPKYFQNYSMIKDILERNLSQFKTIITHNPWGESEHAEHAQVYQIVKQLQSKFNYSIYYSNYIHWVFEDCIEFANKMIKERNIFSYADKIDINAQLCMDIKKKYDDFKIWSGHPDHKWNQKYDIFYEDKNYEECQESMKIRPLFGEIPKFIKPQEPEYPKIF